MHGAGSLNIICRQIKRLSVEIISWSLPSAGLNHRYLISRLSLQVFYLWRHVLSTAPLLTLWWWNFEILLGPLHRSFPSIGELRCQAIQTEHSPYIAERSRKAVYIVRCLWSKPELRAPFQPLWGESDTIFEQKGKGRWAVYCIQFCGSWTPCWGLQFLC
jgi:hypothetical protein